MILPKMFASVTPEVFSANLVGIFAHFCPLDIELVTDYDEFPAFIYLNLDLNFSILILKVRPVQYTGKKMHDILFTNMTLLLKWGKNGAW